jgi:hypothetical protein
MQILCHSTDRLQKTLQDICQNIQIDSDLRITHPDYQPWEILAEYLNRFQQMPTELVNKHLSIQLRDFIYGIYYSGLLRSILKLDRLEQQQKLENNTFLGIDIDFFEQLHTSNCGEGYFEPGWRIIRQENDGVLAVTTGKLTLHINRKLHLKSSDKAASVGDIVSIRTPRNRIQKGFYVAVGNAGLENYNKQDSQVEVVRIYFNIHAQSAVNIVKSITRQLNKIEVPFTFKTLYNPADYKRYDSGVLYFEKSNYNDIFPVIQTIYRENRSNFKPEVPLFTKFLAPGLALAEEPNYKFFGRESFGMNRCQIIANSLLETWRKGDNSPDTRMKAIHQNFLLLNIDLQSCYLNPHSEDIYTSLSL